MLRDESDAPTIVAATPCARCGQPSAHPCWGHRVCPRCAADYYTQAPTYGDIIRKYGSDDDSVRIYTEWAAKWVKAGPRTALAASPGDEQVTDPATVAQ